LLLFKGGRREDAVRPCGPQKRRGRSKRPSVWTIERSTGARRRISRGGRRLSSLACGLGHKQTSNCVQCSAVVSTATTTTTTTFPY